MIDYDKAAIKAAETLVKYGVRTTPVSPLSILEQFDNVIVISFSELSYASGINKNAIIPMFGKNRDAITSVHTENEKPVYVVAYDSFLPTSMTQRALAREMAHIVLRHMESNSDNAAEAECFVHHLLCPRPLLHSIQAIGIRVTVDLIATLTGIYDQSLLSMRHTPGTKVAAQLNCFIRSQFLPFVINFFSFYQHVMPRDGSALADFGTYMDHYIE